MKLNAKELEEKKKEYSEFEFGIITQKDIDNPESNSGGITHLQEDLGKRRYPKSFENKFWRIFNRDVEKMIKHRLIDDPKDSKLATIGKRNEYRYELLCGSDVDQTVRYGVYCE